jgi:AcrR family transcriptional regulator
MMKNGPGQRGVSRAEWLEAAAKILETHGIPEVKIETLARTLGISKSGFYWHFRNRAELLDCLLDHWLHEVTEVITENPKLLELDPRNRLYRVAEVILDYDLVRYEVGIRQWALSNEKAAETVVSVNQMRLDFIGRTMRELGFTGEELEMRTMLFVCYQTWESPMFREIPRESRRKLIKRRVDLITSPEFENSE